VGITEPERNGTKTKKKQTNEQMSPANGRELRDQSDRQKRTKRRIKCSNGIIEHIRRNN